MDLSTLLSIFLTIVGLLGIPSIFASYRRFWKYLYYYIIIKLFNHKPIVINLFLVSKYDEPPSKKLDYQIFNQFKNSQDNKTIKITKQKTRAESMSFLITSKDHLFWIPINVFLDEEFEEDNFEDEKHKIFSYNLTIRLGHNLTLNWKSLDLLDDLTKYFNTLHNILKVNLFKDINHRQNFYVSNINRNFSLEKVKKEYKNDKLGAQRIILDKENLSIIGSNINNLKKIIKKYFMAFSLNIRS